MEIKQVLGWRKEFMLMRMWIIEPFGYNNGVLNHIFLETIMSI